MSFTRDLERGSTAWIGKVRGSLVRLDDRDGKFLIKKLQAQCEAGKTYELTEDDTRKLATHTVNRSDKIVTVSVPDNLFETQEIETEQEATVRESTRIEALISNISARMGLSIWLPCADRAAVLQEWKGESRNVLERISLNYVDTILRTIEQIDVLWLRGRSIVRAFEVEHTTSVYSGILRMADLLAL